MQIGNARASKRGGAGGKMVLGGAPRRGANKRNQAAPVGYHRPSCKNGLQLVSRGSHFSRTSRLTGISSGSVVDAEPDDDDDDDDDEDDDNNDDEDDRRRQQRPRRRQSRR